MVRRVVLVGLLAVGLLIAGGYLGWSGGYSAGLAAEGEVGRWGDGFPGALFFGIAFLFKAFLALMGGLADRQAPVLPEVAHRPLGPPTPRARARVQARILRLAPRSR